MSLIEASLVNAGPGLWRAEDFDDVGRYEQVSGWRIGAMQTTPGTLICTRRELILDGLQWLDEDLRNVTLSTFGDSPTDALVFGISLCGELPVRINGRAWQACEVAIGSGGNSTEIVLPPSRVASLSVHRSLLEEHLYLRDGARLKEWELGTPPLLVRHAPLVDATRTRLLRLAGEVAAEVQHTHLSAAQARILRSEILDLLADVINVTAVAERVVPMHRSLQAEVVRQARRCVVESSADALQVEDLCRATRVSRRTLQRCFLNVVGVTPVQYLRLNRLGQARRMLVDAKSGWRIQDVLGHLGIWHASRFAAEYRALFGELPSETLRQPSRH